MHFRQIGRSIKEAFKAIPVPAAKKTIEHTGIENTVVGEILAEDIVQIKGVSYKKIKLRIVEHNSPVMEAQIERLIDKLASKQHVIEVLNGNNEIKKERILEYQEQLDSLQHKLHLEQVKWSKEKAVLSKNLRYEKEIQEILKEKHANRIDDLKVIIIHQNGYKLDADIIKSENNLLLKKNDFLEKKQAKNELKDTNKTISDLKEKHQILISASNKTINLLKARIDLFEKEDFKRLLRNNIVHSTSSIKENNLMIRDLQFILHEKNEDIKELNLQINLLKSQYESALNTKNKQIEALQNPGIDNTVAIN